MFTHTNKGYGKKHFRTETDKSQRAPIQKIHSHNVGYGEEEYQKPIPPFGTWYFVDRSQSSSHHARYGVCIFQHFRARKYQHGLPCVRFVWKYSFQPYAYGDDYGASLHGEQLRSSHKDARAVFRIPGVKRRIVACDVRLFAHCDDHRHAHSYSRGSAVPLDAFYDHRLVAGNIPFLARSCARALLYLRKIQGYKAPLQRLLDALDVFDSRVLRAVTA